VLVYDLGGGTFDATVLSLKGGDCQVLAACGDNRLGGADFDELLRARAAAAFERDLGPGVFDRDPILRQQLSDLCERAKIELSFRESASIMLPFAGGGRSHPALTVVRREFEDLIGPLIERTLDLVRRVLEEAAVGGIDALVLSGGSSRIPLVRRLLSRTLGREPEGRVNPEEIVAFGAAVFAASANGSAENLRVQDALSRSFGLEIDNDEFITLIPKNAPVPVSRKRTFTTVADDQASVEIHVLQGESPRASLNLSLGRFLLAGIRAGKKGEPRIEVEFSVDPDEILHVRARDLDTLTSQEVTISAHPEGPSPAGIERLQALASRALSLSAAAAGDRAFEAEIAQVVAEVERLAESSTRAGEAERTAALISLEAIVAELDARRTAGG
jgi:molecular chaperone DnaK